jgi:hypothetical protein
MVVVGRRCWPAAMLSALPAVLWACGGPAIPAHSPDSNPLENMPPGEPAAAVPELPPEQIESKKNQFDEEQARIVMARAATGAHTCVDIVDKDQPHGEGTVIVTFSGVGKSTKASIGTPYDGTPIGQCAMRAFVNIIVPPFEGSDVELLQKVNLNRDDKKGAPADTSSKAPQKPPAKPKK